VGPDQRTYGCKSYYGGRNGPLGLLRGLAGRALFMAPPAKRQRGNESGIALRNSILSLFATSPALGAVTAGPLSSALDATLAVETSHGLPVANATVLTSLSCVSTDAGATALESVKVALRNRTASARAVVDVLVDDDEGPPLCCAAALLDDRLLKPADFDSQSLCHRACAALAPLTPGAAACKCGESDPGALTSVIGAFLMSGRCQARDNIFAGLVQPLIVGGLDFMRSGARHHSFLVATRALEFLKTAEMDTEDRDALFTRWVRTSLSVTSDSSQTDAGVNSATVCKLIHGSNLFVTWYTAI
jgi:hypothetical protein